MASRIKGIVVKIGGDTTGLLKSLEKVNSTVKSTQSQLKDVDKLLKLDPKNTELLAQKQKLLGDSISAVKDKLGTLKTVAEQANSALANGDISQSQYDALQREIIETEHELQNLEAEAGKATTALQKIGSAGEVFKTVGDKISNVGTTLTKNVTVPILAVGTAAVKTASDFDTAMSQVAAVSGATGEEIEALRAKAREMGSKTKFSASEAAEGFNYMAMAGWKTQEMISGIDGVLDLAAASGESLGTTSDIVTDALTAFGMKADQSGHFADILAAASSNANTNVSMMGETFKYAAPVMGAMGYSAEDAAIAIGLMANSGIKASSAGTSLRGLLTNLAAPTDKVAKAMSDVGVSLDDGEGHMLSFRDVMIQLREGFGGLKMSAEEFSKQEEYVKQLYEEGTITEKQYSKRMDDLIEKAFGADGALKAQAASMLAGKNAMSGLLAIVNASDADFDKLINSVDNCDGTAKRMADTMQDNLGGQLTILKSQLEELAISIGEILMPVLRKIVAKIQNFIDKLNQLDPETKEMIVKIGLAAAAAGPLLVVFGKLTSGIGSVISVASKLPSLITSVQSGFSALSGVLGISGGAIAAIVAAVIALVAAFMYLWNTNEDFRKRIIEIWTEIKSTFTELTQGIVDRLNELGFDFKDFADLLMTLWNGLCDLLAPVFTGVFQYIADTFEAITGVILGILDTFIGLFTGDWEQCWNGVKGIFTSIFGGLWKWIKNIFTTLKDFTDVILGWFGTSWEEIGNGLSDFFTGIWDKIKFSFNFGKAYITSVWNSIKAYFSETFNNIYETVSGALTSVYNFFAETFNSIWTSVSGFCTSIFDTVTGVCTSIYEFVSPVLDAFKYLFETIFEAISILVGEAFDWILDKITAVWDAITDYIGPVLDKISSFFSKAWDYISGVVSSAMDFVWNKITSVWNSISSAVSGVMSSISNAISGAWNGVKTYLSGAMDSIKTKIVSTWDNVKSSVSDKIGGIYDTIKGGFQKAIDYIKGLPAEAFNWGKDIVNGIVDGLKSCVDWLSDGLEGIADTIRSYLHFSVPDVGPLTDFESWMPDFMKGLADGINKSKYLVEKAVSGVAQTLKVNVDSDFNGISGAIVNGKNKPSVVNNYYNNDNSRTVNQTNNSPKALSRLEIYRMTKNAVTSK